MQANYIDVLAAAQEYFSKKYYTLLAEDDDQKKLRLKPYLDKYLWEAGYRDGDVDGLTQEAVSELLYRDMAQYGILTNYLGREDLEEININAWDDVCLTYMDGRLEKCGGFPSPENAVNIVKRLLENSGMVLDDGTPLAQGHLPGNTRVTALKAPLIDEEHGVSASIRLLHPARYDCGALLQSGMATQEMIHFLCACLRYGISFVIAGVTSSGKTTLLNALLETIPKERRIFTIESGARELNLIRREPDGRILNNVVHTLSRPSDKQEYDYSQEDLVVASLRFNPDVVCIGEMRDSEAYAAVEASMTGHTVVSSIHASAGAGTHMRLALLTQKRFPIDFDISLLQAAQAFPIVVYAQKLEERARKVMDITECEILPDNTRKYRTLYRYRIDHNTVVNGITMIDGAFEKVNKMSESLRTRLIQGGIPQDLLARFMGENP